MTTIPNLNPIPAITGDDYLITHDTATNRSGRVAALDLKTYIKDAIIAAVDIPSTAVSHGAGTVSSALAAKADLSSLAASSGSSLIGMTQGLTGSTARTQASKNKDTVSVLDFMTSGEIADVMSGSPVIDVGPKFNLALAVSKHVVVLGYKYLINTTVSILDDTTLECHGATLKTTNDSLHVMESLTRTGWSIIGKVVFEGTRTTPVAITGGIGLYITNGKRYRVENVEMRNFKGTGFYLGGLTAGTLRGDRGTFDNISAYNCAVGVDIQLGAGSEYNTWIAPNISGCDLGIAMTAGNNVVIGGSIVDNTNNVKLTAGGNHCHGAFVGVNINHATVWNLWVDGVTYGHDFMGCHFYGNGGGSGDIWLDNCQGITINGGHLDCDIYNYSGGSSGYNYILNMYCPGGYGDVNRYDAVNAVPQELIIKGCYGPGPYDAGVSINDPQEVYVSASRVSLSTQALSGVTQLVLPSVVSNGDRRRAYNTTTGVITVPTLQAGQYRLLANLYFTGTAVATTSYVEVRLNGTALTIYPVIPYSATAGSCTVALDVYLDAGDIVTLHASVGGTDVVFGGPTYRSTLSLERIG